MARSAGLLLFRRAEAGIAVLLVHPGGPYWRRRDAGAWQIPKGGIEAGEASATAALREFEEELGSRPDGPLYSLGTIRQAGGKFVEAFAIEGDFDCEAVVSNLFEMEWPPRSGLMQSFPEVDRASWMSLDEARAMMLPSQLPLLDRLGHLVDTHSSG